MTERPINPPECEYCGAPLSSHYETICDDCELERDADEERGRYADTMEAD